MTRVQNRVSNIFDRKSQDRDKNTNKKNKFNDEEKLFRGNNTT